MKLKSHLWLKEPGLSTPTSPQCLALINTLSPHLQTLEIHIAEIKSLGYYWKYTLPCTAHVKLYNFHHFCFCLGLFCVTLYLLLLSLYFIDSWVLGQNEPQNWKISFFVMELFWINMLKMSCFFHFLTKCVYPCIKFNLVQHHTKIICQILIISIDTSSIYFDEWMNEWMIFYWTITTVRLKTIF